MSQFLPDPLRLKESEFLKPPDSEAGNLSGPDRRTQRKYFASVNDFPPEFKGWLTDFILQDVVPLMPVRQIQGGNGAAMQIASTNANLSAHINDTTDAHDASAVSFVPDGSIAATNVQAAIVEVRDEATGASAVSAATIIAVSG